MFLPHGFEPNDFDAHHGQVPGLLAQGRDALAAEAAPRASSLALRLDDGRAYTQRHDGAHGPR